MLLAGVVVKDGAGRDISDLVTVEPKTFDTSRVGAQDVVYSVTDKYGNQYSTTVKVMIGEIDYKDIEIGKVGRLETLYLGPIQ